MDKDHINGIKKNRVEVFDESTPWEIREQILRYHAASLMSDTERAKFLGLPETCRIREGAKIISPENFVCGDYVWIGENAILDASGGLTIGSHTSIGLSVFVWTHSSFRLNLTGQNIPTHKREDGNPAIERKKTTIGSYCFIAGPSVILPGITIGDRVIVGPLSVVDRDLPDKTVFSTTKHLKLLEKRIARLEALIEKQGDDC